MVNCQDFSLSLYGFVAKELPPEQQGEMDQHLADCAGCRKLLEQYQQTLHLAHSLPQAPPPESLLKRFKAALKNDLSPTKPDRD
jgi:hypothetical protein